jgi:hypothetical protein
MQIGRLLLRRQRLDSGGQGLFWRRSPCSEDQMVGRSSLGMDILSQDGNRLGHAIFGADSGSQL